MMRHLRGGTLMLTLVGTIGLAAAQSDRPGDPGGLALTPRQRDAIYQTVSREKDRVRTPPASTRAAVGAELPAWIELYTLPDEVGAEIPATKLYKYTIVQEQVVIVDPTTMKVVDVIRR
jgi:hypothetical protein